MNDSNDPRALKQSKYGGGGGVWTTLHQTPEVQGANMAQRAPSHDITAAVMTRTNTEAPPAATDVEMGGRSMQLVRFTTRHSH